MRDILGITIIFSGFFLSACSSCKGMSASDVVDNEKQNAEIVVSSVSNDESKQVIDPCPTFEVQSVSCNRKMSTHTDIRKKAKVVIDKISSDPKVVKDTQSNNE